MINLHSIPAVNERMHELAGKRFRFEMNEERFMTIPLRADRGGLYLHDQETVGVFIQTKMPNLTYDHIARKCPNATIHQIGEGEIVILHPIDSKLHKFFRACGAKTRRILTEEEKDKLVESGRGTRLQK